jgi:multidrug efflux pump subunit AcrA (membrane-fusion protein)
MRRPRLVPVLFTVGALGFAALGVSSINASSSDAVPITELAATAQLGTVREIVSGTGTVQPIRQVNLSFSNAGRVASVLVKPGARVAAGDWLARVDAPGLAAAVADAEQREALAAAAVASAQASTQAAATQIDAAEARRRSAADGPRPADRAEAAAALQQAQLALTNANTALADAIASRDAVVGTSDAALRKLDGDRVLAQSAADRAAAARTAAQSKLEAARNRLKTAETAAAPKIAQALALPDVTIEEQQARKAALDIARADVVVATEAVTAAAAALTEAETASSAAADALVKIHFEILANPASASQALTSANVAVSNAQQQVNTAAGNIEVIKAANAKRLEAPRDSTIDEAAAGVDIATSGLSVAQQAEATARQGIEQAAAATTGAKEVLAETLLWAPFGGVIAQVNVKEGELSTASANATVGATSTGSAPAFVLLDDTTVQVRITLPEVDAAKVTVGLPVEVAFDALPDEAALGTVASIDVTATSVNNVISYGVVVELDDVGDAVKLGMTASVDVIVAESNNVIAVAQSAVLETDDGPAVLKVVADRKDPIESPVVVGTKGDGLVEITEGLVVGEQYLADAGGGAISSSLGL